MLLTSHGCVQRLIPYTLHKKAHFFFFVNFSVDLSFFDWFKTS